MKQEEIHAAIAILRRQYRLWRTPAVTVVAAGKRDPFKVLVSCIISLRTKDAVTEAASARLFAAADTPEAMQDLSLAELERLIFPAGFYRVKALQIKEIARRIIVDFSGRVPDELDELLRFKGVGRKTANLVLTLGFGKPGICVDTHVHRICNRWGYLQTKNAEETEMRLRAQLPQEYWIEINDLLVAFGQNHCSPRSPRCSTCCVGHLCARVGVDVFR